MFHARSVFTARNAALLGVIALVAFFASADVALPLQVRVPGIAFLLFVAGALVIWNRVAPIRQGGVAHVHARSQLRRRPRRWRR